MCFCCGRPSLSTWHLGNTAALSRTTLITRRSTASRTQVVCFSTRANGSLDISDESHSPKWICNQSHPLLPLSLLRASARPAPCIQCVCFFQQPSTSILNARQPPTIIIITTTTSATDLSTESSVSSPNQLNRRSVLGGMLRGVPNDIRV